MNTTTTRSSLRQRAAELISAALAIAGHQVSQPALTSEVVAILLAEAGDDPHQLRQALTEALTALVADVLRNRLRTGRTLDALSSLTVVQQQPDDNNDTDATDADTDDETGAQQAAQPQRLPNGGWYETVEPGITLQLMTMNRPQLKQAIDARLHRIGGDWHRIHLLTRLASGLHNDAELVGTRYSKADVIQISLTMTYPPLSALLGAPYINLGHPKSQGDGNVAAD